MSEFAAVIRAAGRTWYEENSPCTSEDRSPAPNITYGGTTTNEGDFKTEGGSTTCSDRDNVAIDSGNLDKSGTGTYVALNCYWYSTETYEMLESDIRFNTTDLDFTLTPATGCSNDYDVQSVMTHEFGHTHGLPDRTDSKYAYQTMYGSSYTCRALARSLGRNDVGDLRFQYR